MSDMKIIKHANPSEACSDAKSFVLERYHGEMLHVCVFNDSSEEIVDVCADHERTVMLIDKFFKKTKSDSGFAILKFEHVGHNETVLIAMRNETFGFFEDQIDEIRESISFMDIGKSLVIRDGGEYTLGLVYSILTKLCDFSDDDLADFNNLDKQIIMRQYSRYVSRFDELQQSMPTSQASRIAMDEMAQSFKKILRLPS